MPDEQQNTARLIIPVNHTLNDDDDASVELTRHSVHHQHAVTLMVTIVGEPRTVWLDRYDLQRLELAVATARRWLGDPASDQAAATTCSTCGRDRGLEALRLSGD